MRFTLGANLLTAAVSYVVKAIPARPVQPVVAGVVLHAGDGHLTVSATDGEGGASCVARVPADVAEEGTVLVMGRLLADIAGNLKEDVSVAVDGAKLRITAGKARFALPLMPLDTYPGGLPDDEGTSGTVDTAVFAAAIAQVALAAAEPHSPNPMLRCVHLTLTKDSIALAATDRYRLSTRQIPWKSSLKPSESVSLTVPAKVLATLVAGLAKDGDELTVSVANQAVLSVAGATRTAKFTANDGAGYPGVQALFPKAFTASATVNAKRALETLSRVAIVSGPSDPVELTFGPDLVTFRAGRSEDASASVDEVPAKFTGEEFKVLVNPAYLRDGLHACGDVDVEVQLVSPAKPIVLAPVDESRFRHLLMVVRDMP